ncbi:tyrosine-type recombinase/integrase [Streptomyces sp. NRRL B-24484]|uniref:tyrosine-type recombinase/integrase n=1 Tax=Streptomyces sp. NRRL B-24484 TaxID=1463833 RepID=UPI0004C1DBE6|nr:site-specific integrase [Streptomyces sp. NRRL B-24484]
MDTTEEETYERRVPEAASPGVAVRPGHLRTTFLEWSQQWITSKERRPGTQGSYEINLRKHIQPAFGGMLLHRIETPHVQAWVNGLKAKGLAPRTVHLIYKTFRACINSAVRKRVLLHSPCVDIDLPEVKKKRFVPATREQVWALHQAMPAHSRALIMVGVGCGLRSGEALGLCEDVIDFDSGVLVVRRQVIKVKSQARLVEYNKSATSHMREVPLPAFARKALLLHLGTQGVLATPDGHRVLFRSSRGKLFRRDAFYKTFKRALKETGLPEGFRFHDLRHTFASHALDQGVPESTVQLYMGHASTEELKGTYHHQVKGAAARDRAALEAVFSGGTYEVEAPAGMEVDEDADE